MTSVVVTTTAIVYTTSGGKKLEAARALLASPLWPGDTFAEARSIWQQLRGEMIKAQAGFNVWLDWYEKRLAGTALDLPVEKLWAAAAGGHGRSSLPTSTGHSW